MTPVRDQPPFVVRSAADRTTVVARSRNLAKHEHARTRRAFSQNFLADPVAVRRIAEAAELKPDDLVVEVGAGRGHLTMALVDRCKEVIAYEVDPVMAATVPRRAGLTVRAEDFLRAQPPARRFAVVGNPPYSLTSPIVDWCLRAPMLTSATLLTQLEYARKRTGHYDRWTRLTIITWPTVAWQFRGRIPRGSFRPVPRVDSGILRCRAARLAEDTPVGMVWPEQWLTLFRILER
jgi:23S rRNA (adenine-N6)-dimethyltransferase